MLPEYLLCAKHYARGNFNEIVSALSSLKSTGEPRWSHLEQIINNIEVNIIYDNFLIKPLILK